MSRVRMLDRTVWTALLAVWLVATAAFAQQEYTVSVSVEPTSGITAMTPFNVIVQIEGAQPPGMVQPSQFRKVEGLSLVGGPNTYLQTQRINGRMQSTYRLSYTFIAERPGRFTIPGIRLDVAGRSYTTDPVSFDVVAAEKRTAQDQPDPIFVEARLGAKEAWVGQPVPLSVTLYGRYRISNIGFQRTPDLGSGFWVEQIDVDAGREKFQTRIDGMLYDGYPVDRKMLVPLAAGEYTIEPYVAQVEYRPPGRSAFDFFGRTEAQLCRTKELTLKVKPLPANEPDDFSGAVGSFSLDVGVDRDRARVNDAVALRATIEGEGSLQSVEPPRLDEPEGVKVFEPKLTESTLNVTGKMVSRKTWEWIIVPLDPGDVEIPELSFSFFDPNTGSYRTAASAPVRLAVEQGAETSDPTTVRGEIQLQRRDLAYIKPLRGELSQRYPRAHERPVFRLALLAPLLLTPLLIVLGRRQARLRRDKGLSRGRRAGSRARRRLQSIRKRMEQLESAAFHEEVARALVDYVADRFNRSPSGMTYELADELLAGRGVDEELRRRFRTCLETCDFARFVPSASKSERRVEVLDDVRTVIDRLEATL